MSDEFTADLAVVLGIGAYDPAVGRLETPVGDAEAVADLLASRFGYEVILQCDGTATLAGLRTLLLVDLPQRVHAGSRLLVYFAGHGVAQDSVELEGPRGYLVPHGATSKVGTHLPMHELYEALAKLPCRHLLVVLDCCFAGSFRWADRRPVHIPGELLYEERYRHWVQHPARWVLASSAHDEYALDTAGHRRGEESSHSPFAAALLDGLAGEADIRPQGGDGIVTLAELYAYVQDRLAPHQSPLVAPLPGQTRGEFVFRDLHRLRPLVSAEQAVHLDENQNPYRGLKPYRAEHSELFFGRGEATDQLFRHLCLHPLTVVVGPSGGGKSSLVQAGLLPILTDHPDESWSIPTPLRVTGDPLAALHAALTAAAGPPPPSVAQLRDDPEAVRVWIAAWQAACPGEHLLIVVDQAEELVTHGIPEGMEAPEALPEASIRFLACLAALLENGDGRSHALVVVRSDYEPDLEEDSLAPLWRAGRFVVPPLTRQELRQVIEGPAGCKALYFDDPGLVDRLADEVVGMPGGLPLLSYALSRLYLAYLRNGRGDRLLTASDFAAIGGESPPGPGGSVAPGGIVRILRVEADRAVRELPDFSHRRTLWKILLRMVNLVGTRPTRRQVPLTELDYPRSGENDRVATVLRSFIDKERLLVSDRAVDLSPGGSGVVEPAHDELLVAWPQLVRRIDAARDLLPVHRRLTEAAAAWESGTGNAQGERHRKRDLDLRLLGLVEASRLPEDELNRHETEYVAAARAERRRRTMLRWTTVAAALLLTSGAALFFRYQSHIARSRELAALALAADQRDRGLLLAEAAYRVQPTLEARASLFSLLSTLRHAEVFLHGLPPGARGVALSPDGRLVAAGGDGGKILIWDLTRPSRPRCSFEPPQGPNGLWNKVHALDFSGEGKELVATYEWGGVRIWRLSSGEGRPIAGWPPVTEGTRRVSTNWYGADPEPPERRGERPATALALDRPGRRAVVGDFSGRLIEIDLATSAVAWTRQLELYNIVALELLPRERTVLAADGGGKLTAITPESMKAPTFSSQPHSSGLVLLRYLPLKKQLLSLDSTGHLVLWRRTTSGFTVEDQASIPLLPVTAELDLTRGRVLVASSNGQIRSFSLETKKELAGEALQGHRLASLSIRCSATYPRCVSGGLGGEVIVWNVERVHPLLAATRQVNDMMALRVRSNGSFEVLETNDSGFVWSALEPRGVAHRRSFEKLSGIGAQDDGDALVLGFSDGRIVLLENPDSRKGTALGRSDPPTGGIGTLAVSKRMVVGIDGQHLSLWRRDHPVAPFFERDLREPVSSLLFSPDDRLLVVGHQQGLLTRLNLTQMPPQVESRRVSVRPIVALAFSPDGSQLFTGSGPYSGAVGENLAESDRRIRLWNPWTLQLVRELPDRHASGLLELHVSSDSKLLVSSAIDGEVVVWDINDWREVGSFPTTLPPTPPGEPPTVLQAVAFDRQTSRLVTATDRQLWIWRIKDDDALEMACQIANRTIGNIEWQESVGGSQPKTECKRFSNARAID